MAVASDAFSLEASIEFEHHEPCDSEDHDNDTDDCEDPLYETLDLKALNHLAFSSQNKLSASLNSHYTAPYLDGVKRPPRA